MNLQDKLLEEIAEKYAIEYIVPITKRPITPYEKGAIKEVKMHFVNGARYILEKMN